MKDYDKWNNLKKRIDASDNNIFFKERDVWWAHLGLNVGHEENGKNDSYTRPILVLRKFNKRIFLGIPLTTQIKDNKYYYKISFKDQKQCVMLSQIRVLEHKRLMRKMGEVSEKEFFNLRNSVARMIKYGIN